VAAEKEEGGMMNLFPAHPVDYRELPPEAPKPVMWKSLGHCMAGVEMHYGLETFGGDLDIDRESEMKYELTVVAQTLFNIGALVDGLMLAQQAGHRRVVRFVQCTCGSNLWTTRN
jgi:hypothetical protein